MIKKVGNKLIDNTIWFDEIDKTTKDAVNILIDENNELKSEIELLKEQMKAYTDEINLLLNKVKKYEKDLEKDLKKFKSILKYSKNSEYGDWLHIRRICEGRKYELECKILKDIEK